MVQVTIIEQASSGCGFIYVVLVLFFSLIPFSVACVLFRREIYERLNEVFRCFDKASIIIDDHTPVIDLSGDFLNIIPEKKYNKLDEIKDQLYRRTQKRKHVEEEIAEFNIRKIALEIEEAKRINQEQEDIDQEKLAKQEQVEREEREALEKKLSQIEEERDRLVKELCKSQIS